MDNDLFGQMKSHPPSGKGTAKGSGKEVPSNPKPAGTLTANEKGTWKLALCPMSFFFFPYELSVLS